MTAQLRSVRVIASRKISEKPNLVNETVGLELGTWCTQLLTCLSELESIVWIDVKLNHTFSDSMTLLTVCSR